MASTLSLFPATDYHHYFFSHSKPISKSKFRSFSIPNPKSNHSNFTSFSTSSNNSPISQETHKTPSKFGSFLTNDELQKLEFLQNYGYSIKLSSGLLIIRAMNDFEVDLIVELLAESFIESMLLPNMYLKVLGFLIKQYLIERRGLVPHAVTLIGFLKVDDEDENKIGNLVGTVEVSFDRMGSNSSPPTPTPPKNSPYICNMTVKKEFRRRGIGWHLLKASEELILNMTSLRDVYLHCRLIDTAPFSMYIKAGYEVVKTDSFLILLTLQRRKHLMCKELPILSKPSETVITEDEVPSLVVRGESEPLDDEVPSLASASESEPLLFDEVGKNSPDMDTRILASD